MAVECLQVGNASLRRHFEIRQDGRCDELLPNQSLKLRSAFRGFFVDNDRVVETVQASNNQPATLQFT
jgi:hypothetical protein